jgi:hypothetical protein
MKRTRRLFHFSILIIALLVTSCATTSVTSVWKDESYKGQIYDVFVIGVAKNEINRKIFEDEFVEQLKAHGVSAMPSYKVLPSNKLLGKETVVAKIREYEMDTVLVTAVVDKERRVFSDTYYNYYEYGYHGYGSGAPTLTYDEDVYYLETKIFDAGTEKLIWSASSETFFIADYAPIGNMEIKSFIDVMVKKIKEDNLLK